jgi:hypothetical protein
MSDALGQELNINDYICYPSQSGHCVSMNVGVVVGFKEDNEGYVTSVRVKAVRIKSDETPVKGSKTCSINKFENIIRLDNLPNIFKMEVM